MKKSMSLIMAQSSDGYFAAGENDDMKWTGKKDKLAFKLLTNEGNTNLLCGLNTALNMPELEGRSLWAVRSGNQAGWISRNGFIINEITYASISHRTFYGAKVIGGPKLAKSVIKDGYIKYAYISVIPTELKQGLGKELTEYLNKFSYTSINFDGLEIKKYKL
jgi:dihydrofolate reductase